MVEKEVRFSHDYDKLMLDVFPTVRSMDYMYVHNFKVNDYVTIISPSMKFQAKCIGHEDWKLMDLELSFLKYDCSPLKCDNLSDYLNILDSFARYPCHQPTTIKRILWFQKVKGKIS